MKAQVECIPCLFRQALNTARAASSDPALHEEVLRRVAEYVAGASFEMSPAQYSQPLYRIVSEVTGNPDPYWQQKQEANQLALELLSAMRQTVNKSADPLDAALHAAAAGNVIDLGIGQKFDLTKDVLDFMRQPMAISVLEQFRQELRHGRRLLLLGDNAGEIVFDILLVEQLLQAGVQVTYVVKSGPVINDALMADAEAVGMTRLVPVIETGSDAIGVNWEDVSQEFQEAVDAAHIILGKGHGNFETSHDRPGPFYFLLKAKCELVARTIGCRLGDLVFIQGDRYPRICA